MLEASRRSLVRHRQ